LQQDLDLWAEAVRQVARETNTPLVDLNARSASAVRALGPMTSARLAQQPPPPEVASVLLTGASAPVPAAPSAPASVPAAIQKNAAVEPLGQARTSFDYTHLGREGADFFAAIVAQELAVAVPGTRRLIIP